MDRLIIRSLPRDVRARHGEEIADLLACSRRPVRDRVDVLIAALGSRLDATIRPVLVVALVGVGGFTAGLLYAIGNLRDGAVEVLDHWWSTSVLAGLMGAISTVLVLVLAQRRAAVWRRPG